MQWCLQLTGGVGANADVRESSLVSADWPFHGIVPFIFGVDGRLFSYYSLLFRALSWARNTIQIHAPPSHTEECATVYLVP